METTLSRSLHLKESEARSRGEKNERLKREATWMLSAQALIDDG